MVRSRVQKRAGRIIRKRKLGAYRRIRKRTETTKRKLPVFNPGMKNYKQHKSMIDFKPPEYFCTRNIAKRVEKRRYKDMCTWKKHAVRPPPSCKVLFVYRRKSYFGLPRRIDSIFKKLRLTKFPTGVFVQPTPSMLSKLRLIERYVIIGTPSPHTVREVLNRRGVTFVDHKPVPLSTNLVIEKALGKYNIVCVEDLVNQIANGGKQFRTIVGKFLAPCRLVEPKFKFVSRPERTMLAEDDAVDEIRKKRAEMRYEKRRIAEEKGADRMFPGHDRGIRGYIGDAINEYLKIRL
ncbi:60S ribosomal protein L7 [Pelomyxa schiedti]|nr:60S ribosomal protein L7 [Pelomyxa schiedti]